jgi:PadR family transcriptional regulator PadR
MLVCYPPASEATTVEGIPTMATKLTKVPVGVFEVLLADAPAWGLRICVDAHLESGTVYPILDRLAELGWVTRWEEIGPHAGHPLRRFYALTGANRLHAATVLTLDPQVQALLDAMAARGTGYDKLTVAAARKSTSAFIALQGEAEPVAEVSDGPSRARPARSRCGSTSPRPTSGRFR